MKLNVSWGYIIGILYYMHVLHGSCNANQQSTFQSNFKWYKWLKKIISILRALAFNCYIVITETIRSGTDGARSWYAFVQLNESKSTVVKLGCFTLGKEYGGYISRNSSTPSEPANRKYRYSQNHVCFSQYNMENYVKIFDLFDLLFELFKKASRIPWSFANSFNMFIFK